MSISARTRERFRRLALGLVVIAVLSTLTAIAAASWLGTDAGHDFVARRLESVISGQIRGRLVIGGIDSVDTHRVVAHDVRFEDESGRPVIEADRVDMTYDADALLHGRFVSHSARADGGRVTLETDPSGELLINRAFRSAHMGPPGAPVGDDVVHLDHLIADDVAVVLDLGDAPHTTLGHVGAEVLVRAPENGAAIVQASHVHGALHVAAPIPFDLRVIAASLAVDGSAHRRIHIDLPSRMGTERIGVEVTALAQPDDTLRVDARIRPHGLGAMASAAGMISQALLAETQTPELDVTVELQ